MDFIPKGQLQFYIHSNHYRHADINIYREHRLVCFQNQVEDIVNTFIWWAGVSEFDSMINLEPLMISPELL